MTHLVVLRFDNDKEAEEFATEYFEEPDDGIEYFNGRIYPELVALYKVPTERTKHCECSNDVKSQNARGDTLSSRGKKFGWYIRRCCKNVPYRSSHMANNLIPEADSDKKLTIHWWNRPWKGTSGSDKR